MPFTEVVFFWALKPLLAALLALDAGAGQGEPMPARPFAASPPSGAQALLATTPALEALLREEAAAAAAAGGGKGGKKSAAKVRLAEGPRGLEGP